jgi:hypothetical protein
MKKFLLLVALFIVLGCGREFEPELKGFKAYTLPGRPQVHLEMDGREATIELPGEGKVGYRFAQWTKQQDHLLLSQIVKTESCYDYQIISIDTSGTIIDTIYTGPPNTAVNFKLAPNDSLLLLKTYDINCVDKGSNFKYTFYNRFAKQALYDTVDFGSSAGILLHETIWSPDSKKVILPNWTGLIIEACVYDLATRDTTYIDTGSNFIWSPTDNDIVSYIKDYSIYTMNLATREKEILYHGKKKRGATAFRWNPNGDFLMIHFKSYLLNVEAGPLQQNRIIYVSIKDKSESRIYYDDQRIDTWKDYQ